uniref:Transmembrane channel-like protein n=1 Tax=Labrus bergylta TaxID=56723 RepID=A0A3Q3F084_9LABR
MFMCPSARSPIDEEGVHDSFTQLIAEQSQNGGQPDAIELQQLQRELDEEGRGNLQSRPSIKDFSHSARPSIRGYGMEADSTDAQDAEASKRERLVNNLQNLSAGDRERMLKAMPLSVREKHELRWVFSLKKRTLSGSKIPCCSHLKYYIIIAVRQSWYSWLSFLHSLQLWQVALKRVSGRFGSGVLSYFLFLQTLLFFNLFLFLVTGAFMVLPQAVLPPIQETGSNSFSGLELLTGVGYFSNSVMYYGYYCNYTLRDECQDDVGLKNLSVLHETRQDCMSKQHSYNMPLAYFFTIGVAFFITSYNYLFFCFCVCRLFSEKVLKRRRRPVFDIARNVLDLIYGQTLAWLGVLFTPLLPAVQVLKLLVLFYIKKSSVMMNCQAPRRPYRVSQMHTIFITLLCFPSFLGASVCVTYTMWSITPSSSCGPFRGLKTMLQAGKRLVEELEKDNPNLSPLVWVHSYLVENPFFLFVGAGIFLIVIYFHSQVVDGERKIISLLQEQIENVNIPSYITTLSPSLCNFKAIYKAG